MGCTYRLTYGVNMVLLTVKAHSSLSKLQLPSEYDINLKWQYS